MAIFTVSVIPGESEVHCETLDEALTHLREAIQSELEDYVPDEDEAGGSEFVLRFDMAGAMEIVNRVQTA